MRVRRANYRDQPLVVHIAHLHLGQAVFLRS
jgi:hypothetical protein